MSKKGVIATDRRGLIPATAAQLQAELESRTAFAEAAVRYSLRWVCEHPPDPSGMVELGYGIVPDHQRQGFASEAILGWVEFAFAPPTVQTVVGQTLPQLTPSVGVLRKAGFRFAGNGHDPHAPEGERVIRYELSCQEFGGRGLIPQRVQ